MGPTWVLSAPGGPHIGPMNLAIWVGIDQATNHYRKQFWSSLLMHICDTRSRWVNEIIFKHIDMIPLYWVAILFLREGLPAILMKYCSWFGKHIKKKSTDCSGQIKATRHTSNDGYILLNKYENLLFGGHLRGKILLYTLINDVLIHLFSLCIICTPALAVYHIRLRVCRIQCIIISATASPALLLWSNYVKTISWRRFVVIMTLLLRHMSCGSRRVPFVSPFCS